MAIRLFYGFIIYFIIGSCIMAFYLRVLYEKIPRWIEEEPEKMRHYIPRLVNLMDKIEQGRLLFLVVGGLTWPVIMYMVVMKKEK